MASTSINATNRIINAKAEFLFAGFLYIELIDHQTRHPSHTHAQSAARPIENHAQSAAPQTISVDQRI